MPRFKSTDAANVWADEQPAADYLGGELLIVSGNGPGPKGWLFAVQANHDGSVLVEQVDSLNSFGLMHMDSRLYRVLSSEPARGASGELICYDERGVEWYRRVDGLADPHGIVWDGSHFVVPCSATNEILWLDREGSISKRWRAPGEDDSWHINGLTMHLGTLYASAFGRCATKEETLARISDESSPGVVFDVETGETLISRLDCPHDPFFLDGRWLVCNSRLRQLLAYSDPSGTPDRVVNLDGWTRGVSYTSRAIFVGESAERHASGEPGKSHLAVISRENLQLVSRIDLPCQEVLSVATVPRQLLEGVRRGFRTNSYRVMVQDREDLWRATGSLKSVTDWTPMEALDVEDSKVSILLEGPPVAMAGSSVTIQVTVENRGSKVLFSSPPYPINIAYRWLDIAERPLALEVDEHHFAMSSALAPGASGSTTITLTTPDVVGNFVLHVSLVQESIRWFDQADGTSFARMGVALIAKAGEGELIDESLEAGDLAQLQLGRDGKPRMRALLPHACKANVRAVGPDRVAPGRKFMLDVMIENRSDVTYVSADPYPIMIGTAWRLEGDPVPASTEGRFPLDIALRPGEALHMSITVVAPTSLGRFTLSVSLIQEWIRWFDELDEENGCALNVNVGHDADQYPFTRHLQVLSELEKSLSFLNSAE